MTICSIQNCGRAVYSKKMCRAHYARNRRHGNPLAGNTMEGDPMRAICDAATSATDGCIEWPFAKSGNGYALVWLGGRHVPATHVVMQKIGKPRPTEDHQIAHQPLVCRNPACINPRHIRWALATENMADKLVDKTNMEGSKHPRSKLSEADVLAIRADTRPQRKIAEHYQIDAGHVSTIRARKAWRHV